MNTYPYSNIIGVLVNKNTFIRKGALIERRAQNRVITVDNFDWKVFKVLSLVKV